ncbi:adenylate/guanylate cyclase domain-containing protein [Leptospira mayottensis]|uniref:adenylate/guanylate cyclase domain-containing protein n=1 Tax=Leptospira mayottensis TaxID=1137606 RepID=UPI000E35A79B|nr:adenylate/guanylate cyclase domain-containing protein [Leptospira mayottensis]AXR70067.1 hypothetical protein DPV73_18925 [Leptospira mayottensis]
MSEEIDNLMSEEVLKRSSEEIKRSLLEQAFNATIILIDLTNSTGVKGNKPFPEWYGIIEEFYNKTTKIFREYKIEPVKFLGDAVLFFIPDSGDQRAKNYIESQKKIGITVAENINSKTILDICIQTQKEWWNSYKKYLDYPESQENYMSITTAIDYGLVIDFNLGKDGANPDPLGEAVDRCFRISSVAGPGHLLFSNAFREKLSNECENKYIRISVSDTFLKGVKKQEYINYVLPEYE